MEFLIDYSIFFSLVFVPTLLWFYGRYFYIVIKDARLFEEYEHYKQYLIRLKRLMHKQLFRMFLFTAAISSIPFIYEMSQQ